MPTNSFSIRELAERAKREKAIDLAQGVIQASPPPRLLENLRSMPLEHYSTYNNKRGVEEYREALASFLQGRGWPIASSHILGTAGVMGVLVSALLTTLKPGDTVALPEPYFVYHKSLLETLGYVVRTVPVPLNEPPDENLLAKILPDVRALLLTSPANPTGQSVPLPHLRQLLTIAAQTKTIIILDEIYRDFRWDEDVPHDGEYTSLDFSNLVIARSFSKTLAIPGWRAGFAITTPERVEEIAFTHDYVYIGGSTIAQYALAKTLTHNMTEINQYVANLRALLQENRGKLTAAFTAYGMTPLPVPATYYMIIKHNRASDLAAMEELIRQKIATTPLSMLYSDSSKDTGYIRIHFGISRKTCDQVVDILRR